MIKPLRLIRIGKSLLHDASIMDFIGSMKSFLFRSHEILVLVIDSEDSLAKNDEADDGSKVVKGELSQLNRFSRQFNPIPWEFRCHEYDGVKEFFFVEHAGEIQHISWVYHQNDPNRVLKLGPMDIEVKYCLTLPKYRGQGLFPRTLTAIARYYFRRGYEKIFITINANNFSSIRGAEKAGFRRLGKTCERKVLGIQLSRRISF
jgi:RimJ/RimL family protein N-acetyltransferase